MSNREKLTRWQFRLPRLLELYSTGVVTEAFFLSDLADMITPENVDAVMSSIPTEHLPVVMNWIEELREPEPGQVMYWPLPAGVAATLKQWFKRQLTLHK